MDLGCMIELVWDCCQSDIVTLMDLPKENAYVSIFTGVQLVKQSAFLSG